MPNFTTSYVTQTSRKADGTNTGQDTADPITFFGGIPVVQQASAATATDLTTALTLVNALRLALLNYNLIA